MPVSPTVLLPPGVALPPIILLSPRILIPPIILIREWFQSFRRRRASKQAGQHQSHADERQYMTNR